MVDDINPNGASSNPAYLTNVGGELFFRATDGTHGDELWKSDGTSSGTMLVDDINPGPDSSYPTYLMNVNGELYFRASDGTHGFELWKSDGTSSGTVLVEDINPGAKEAAMAGSQEPGCWSPTGTCSSRPTTACTARSSGSTS